ncbi:hypothetical protein [Leuconostoc citreum]|uniref:hypothetical protein n=1 Tax=Leuconostoc citreum TaxID=33964 RepID=UPI0032DEFFDA
MSEDDKKPEAIVAADFDMNAITKSFNDLVAAQKAGDDDDLRTALKAIEKIVVEAVGDKLATEDDPDSKDGDDKKADPFEAVAAKYAK